MSEIESILRNPKENKIMKGFMEIIMDSHKKK